MSAMKTLTYAIRLWLTYKCAPVGVLVIDIDQAQRTNPEEALAVIRAVAAMSPTRRYMIRRSWGPFHWTRVAR